MSCLFCLVSISLRSSTYLWDILFDLLIFLNILNIQYEKYHRSHRYLFLMQFFIRAFILMAASDHYSEYRRQIYTPNLLRVLPIQPQKDYNCHVNYLAVWKVGYLLPLAFFKFIHFLICLSLMSSFYWETLNIVGS